MPRKPLTLDERTHVLERLAFAEKFENVLATKFNTAKRFGLEGCESMIGGMKTMVEQLSTVNQYDKKATRSRRMTEKISEQDTATETATHPLVRVHPETGKPALYLTAMQTTRHFAGLTPEESRPLIEYLLTHATRPEFTCRLRWRPGTLGIWDNRCLLHMALDDYPNHRRVMHRITLKGGPVVGIGTSRVLAE